MTTIPGDAPPTEPLDELYEAFRGLRPDPDAFRAAVRAKVAAGEQRASAEARRLAEAPPYLRWAASLLPPGVVAGAVSAASLGTKKLGLKLVPGLLAIPAVTFLVLVGTFVGGVRALRQDVAPRGDGEVDPREVARAWWKRNTKLVVAGLALLLLLATTRHAELFTAFLALSMVTTVLLLGELARAGLSDRGTVGRAAARMIFGAAWMWYYLNDFLPADPSGLPASTGAQVLAVGGVVVMYAGELWSWRGLVERVWHPDRRMLHPDPVTTACLRVLYGGFALVAGSAALLLCAAGLVMIGGSFSAAVRGQAGERADLVRAVERFDAPVRGDGVQRWLEFGATWRALDEDGGAKPDLAALRGRVRAELGGERLPDAEGVLAVWLDAGLVDGAQVAAAPPADVTRLLARDGDLRVSDYGDVEIALRAGLLDAAGRADLARRLDASEPSETSSLEDLATWARLLDELGAHARLDAHRDALRARLLGYWRGADGRRAPGTFAIYPANEVSSRWLSDSFVRGQDGPPTLAALELMQRVGKPDEVDLARVRRSVDAAAQPWRAWIPWERPGAGWDAARVRLERLAPTNGGVLHAVVLHRTLVGALLFVLLCVVAVRRAPRKETAA